MADINTIVEQLSGLTVLEVADLVKQLETKWGVSAAAPVAAVAAVGGALPASAPDLSEAPCPHVTMDVPDSTLSILLVDACAAPLALIAYVSEKGRLEVMNHAGQTREVKGPKHPLLPSWSENGRRLAFVQESGSGHYTIKAVEIR